MDKKYKYKFTKSFYIIGILGSVIALACIVINAIRFIGLSSKQIVPGFYEYVSLILSVLLSIAFIVFIITAIKSSYYQITDKQVILKWGIIKNKIDISDVKEIKFITNTQKLELTFEDDSYFVIAVSSEWKEDFVDELRKTFPKIPYIQETEEEKK